MFLLPTHKSHTGTFKIMGENFPQETEPWYGYEWSCPEAPIWISQSTFDHRTSSSCVPLCVTMLREQKVCTALRHFWICSKRLIGSGIRDCYALFFILKSYLSERLFLVKQGDARSSLMPIEAGVPQGSVLGPVLYNIYTTDLPTSDDVMVATYADDIAFLAVDDDPETASEKLQRLLNSTSEWLKF